MALDLVYDAHLASGFLTGKTRDEKGYHTF